MSEAARNDEIREALATPLLPPYREHARCPKCDHDVVSTSYQPDTSHYGCPIAKTLRTSYGPEHFTRCCQRCHFTWEEATLDA